MKRNREKNLQRSVSNSFQLYKCSECEAITLFLNWMIRMRIMHHKLTQNVFSMSVVTSLPRRGI